ncbi:hypothetical protein KA005_66700 [bacterium]|nr:hypothetical protein [bacterium]
MLPRRTEKTICSPLSIYGGKMTNTAPVEKTKKLPLKNTRSGALRSYELGEANTLSLRE